MTTLVTTCACGCLQPTRSGLLPPFASEACRARWVHDMHLAELAVHDTAKEPPPLHQPAPLPTEELSPTAPLVARPVPGSWLRRVRGGWSR